jgi:hypothetical protein
MNQTTPAKNITVIIVFQLVLYPSPLFEISEISTSLMSKDFIARDKMLSPLFSSGSVTNGHSLVVESWF